MTKELTMLLIATPPKICVMAKIGMPLTSRATTKKKRGQQRAEDDLPVGQGRGKENVVGLAVFFLGDGAGGEDRREQGDEAQL